MKEKIEIEKGHRRAPHVLEILRAILPPETAIALFTAANGAADIRAYRGRLRTLHAAKHPALTDFRTPEALIAYVENIDTFADLAAAHVSAKREVLFT